MPEDNEKLVAEFVSQRQLLHRQSDSALELKNDMWITSNDNSSIGSRIPFTGEEKEFLCELIQKHVYSKLNGTGEVEPTYHVDANGRRVIASPFCRVPNTAWKAIEEEFNAEESVRKRSIKQLRKCWENLKHRGKINPEALYSGKRLQGTTSVTGGFSLSTAEEEEPQLVQVISPRGDSSPTTSDFNEDSVPASGFATSIAISSQQTSPTNLSTRQVSETPRVQESHANTETTMMSPPFVTSPTVTLSRPTMVTPQISSVRTVRALKPMSDPLRRRLSTNLKHSRENSHRVIPHLAGKSHAQKIHEMKIKLLAAQIKEHEANAEKINMQMRQAQAHHDVTMRLLRTKAAWYDANLRQLGLQLQSGDFSLVGEDDLEYRRNLSDEDEMDYGEDFS